MQRLSLAGILMLAVFVAPVRAQEADLSWKFAKDMKFYQQMSTKTKQNMTIMGQAVNQDQTQEFVFSWTVKEVDDNKVVLEQKIESVNMAIKTGSNEIKFNSKAKDAADNQLAVFFKPLVGASFTLTLDKKTMKVTAIGGREEFVKKLTDANPQMANVLKVILSEDQLKQMAEPAFAVVPNEKKKVGDTWTRESKLSMGPIGSYEAKYTYKYMGKDNQSIEGKEIALDKIEMTPELKYVPPDPSAAGGLPFKIEGGTLATKQGTVGIIWFDSEKGRVAKTEMKVNLEGKLQISVGDQKADVDLKQEQNTSTLTTDKNPDDPKPTP